MWSIRRPTHATLTRFLAEHADDEFSYADVGSVEDAHPVGFNRDVHREIVGQGDSAFDAAKALFRRWRQFPAPWTEIFPRAAPLRTGETLAMVARACGLWWVNACRIVNVIDEQRRFGFAYGTLAEHVECGEEQFLIEISDDGAVWYEIRSFSRPRHWTVRLGYPLARRMQRRFVRESFASLRRFLESPLISDAESMEP